jgi:hypothetical protein
MPEQDKINYRRLHELSDELVRSRVVEEQELVRQLVRGSEVDSEEFQDTTLFSYDRIFSQEVATSGIHQATQGEVKRRNQPGGANYTTLGQLCLIAFYDFWNDYLRREYVIAKGELDPQESDPVVIKKQLQDHASVDLWGDLGILRNSIVHNRGLASSKVARCKLIHWFTPSQPIVLTPSHMRALLLAILKYRNELFKEQFPKRTLRISIPSKYRTPPPNQKQ